MTNAPPILYVVAGPHGSGKRTITQRLITPHGIPILNPGAIQRTLTAADPQPQHLEVAAGREALHRQQAANSRRHELVHRDNPC